MNRTSRIFAVTAFVLSAIGAFGQAVRVDIPIQTSGPTVAYSEGYLPEALWLSNSAVYICTHPSTTLAACQAAPITTYTDSTESTACPATTQMVQLPGSTCTASSSVTANVGFWYAGGIVDYWVVSAYGTYGPFSVNDLEGGTVSGTTGELAMFTGPNALGNSGITQTGTGTSSVVGFQGSLKVGSTFEAGDGFNQINVKAYGAVGDGVTDDTAAITSAIAYLNSSTYGGALYFPAGKYLTTGGFTITAPFTIYGDGSCTQEQANVEDCISVIQDSSPTNVLFTVTSDKGLFQNIGVSNTSSTRPTAGSGVFVNGTDYWQNVSFQNFYAKSFYRCVDHEVGEYWYMDNSLMMDCVEHSLHIDNTVSTDAGDWSVTNTTFSEDTSLGHSGDSAIYIAGSGGGRIQNIKVNSSYTNGVELNCSGSQCSSAQLTMVGDDIENVVYAVNIPSGWSYVTLTDNYFNANHSSGNAAVQIGSSTNNEGSYIYIGGGTIDTADGSDYSVVVDGYSYVQIFPFEGSHYSVAPANHTCNAGWIDSCHDLTSFGTQTPTLTNNYGGGGATSGGQLTLMDTQNGGIGGLILKSYDGTSYHNGYIGASYGSGGIVMEAPRNITGQGYRFYNNGRAIDILQLDSVSGAATIYGPVNAPSFSGSGASLTALPAQVHPLAFADTNATVYTASQVIAKYLSPVAQTIPASGSVTAVGVACTSEATLSTAATASTTFSIDDNGASFGTIAFAAAGTSGTFTISSAKSVTAGNAITFVGPSTADSTAAGLAVSLCSTY